METILATVSHHFIWPDFFAVITSALNKKSPGLEAMSPNDQRKRVWKHPGHGVRYYGQKFSVRSELWHCMGFVTFWKIPPGSLAICNSESKVS
ncbi:hypothetical protein TNCV_2279531 [Trichonephila clavipes]|uniref:Uncharacterized protein n=1 Tax=Trichonephila clavipes TaxID=2585209 RepID=A0A8X6RDM5_TRICX|nr:hypothetical protein TNCV_2279531 [Trichonephila clavipes]